MLVLSRRLDETIFCRDKKSGNEIKLTVLQIGNGRVRIGIAAPDDINIVRGELERKDGESPPSKRDAA